MWTTPHHEPRILALADPFTAGFSAVVLFFLLSGFVLSVPYLRGKGQPYGIYIVRRILRIYAPYFFALLLSVGGAALWHGPLGHGEWADRTWLHPVNSHLVLAHVLMIGNYDWTQYNTAFWSLVIEMRVSIIFPVLFFLIYRMRPRNAIFVALCLYISTVAVVSRWWWLDHSLRFLEYAAVFICGIVLATNIEKVNEWYRRQSLLKRVIFGCAAFVFYTGGHFLATHLRLTAGFDEGFTTIGAIGYLVLALNSFPVRGVLRSSPAKFLGRISYSLYLVHGTVLFALTHALGNKVSVPVHFFLFLSGSLVLAYLFCLGIEEPFLRISRQVSKMAKKRDTSLPPLVAAS